MDGLRIRMDNPKFLLVQIKDLSSRLSIKYLFFLGEIRGKDEQINRIIKKEGGEKEGEIGKSSN